MILEQKRHADQWIKIKDTKTIHISQSCNILDKYDKKTHTPLKRQHLQRMLLENLDIRMQKNEITPVSTMDRKKHKQINFKNAM